MIEVHSRSSIATFKSTFNYPHITILGHDSWSSWPNVALHCLYVPPTDKMTKMCVRKPWSLRGDLHFSTPSQSLYIRSFAWKVAYAAFLCVSKLRTWGPWWPLLSSGSTVPSRRTRRGRCVSSTSTAGRRWASPPTGKGWSTSLPRWRNSSSSLGTTRSPSTAGQTRAEECCFVDLFKLCYLYNVRNTHFVWFSFRLLWD